MKFTMPFGKKKLLLGGGIVVIGIIIFLVVRGGALIASVIYEPGGGTSSGQYDMATADADVCLETLFSEDETVDFTGYIFAPPKEEADEKFQKTDTYKERKDECEKSGVASKFEVDCTEPVSEGWFTRTHTSTCTYSCTSLQKNCCGNKKIEGEVGETCDKGNSAFPDPKHPHPGDCRAPGETGECTNMRCGDGIEDAYDKPDTGEECDDGGKCDTTSSYTEKDGTTVIVKVRKKCAVNGFNPQCKDSNDKPTECKSEQGDGCDDLCREERCGNGRVDVPEPCDSGWVDAVDCDYDCTVVICGDGHTNGFIIDKQSGQTVEECDLGGECLGGVSSSDPLISGKDEMLPCFLDELNPQCRTLNGITTDCTVVSDEECVGCKSVMPSSSADIDAPCHSTPSGGCEGTCDDDTQFCGSIIGVCGCMYPDDSSGME